MPETAGQGLAGRPSVVVLGGGYAGANVARHLDDDADVTLVEPRDAFVHNVGALRALTDPGTWLPRIFLPYDRLLRRGRVLRDRAAAAGPGTVTLASGAELRADYLVLATGSGYPFPAKSDTDLTADARARFRDLHEVLARARRVLLVGAGAVGIELAGEIRSAWPRTQVTLLDAAPDILGAPYRADLKAELRSQLAALGVEVLTGSPLRALPAVPPGRPGVFTVRTEADRAVTADLWFRCFGVTPASACLAGPLAGARRADGFVSVTPYLQVAGQERVFALGDVADAGLKLAGSARRQAGVVAANIRALAAGGALTAWEPGEPVIVVPVGPDGGSGQVAGSAELLTAAQASALKGRDLLTARYAELLRR